MLLSNLLSSIVFQGNAAILFVVICIALVICVISFVVALISIIKTNSTMFTEKMANERLKEGDYKGAKMYLNQEEIRRRGKDKRRKSKQSNIIDVLEKQKNNKTKNKNEDSKSSEDNKDEGSVTMSFGRK